MMKSKFYDINKILPLNGPLNFISGKRGSGKIYSLNKGVFTQSKNEKQILRYK